MINWKSIINAGIFGGIAMSLWIMIMHKLNLTAMDLGIYDGSFITGSATGTATLIAGLLIHLSVSVIISFIYAFAYDKILGAASAFYGTVLGTFHWLISGIAVHFMDKMNPLVQQGQIPPLKLYAHGYGLASILIFLIGHLIYGFFNGLYYQITGSKPFIYYKK